MYHALKLCSAVAVLIAAGVALAPMPATVHMLVQSAAHSTQPPHAPPGVPTLLPSNDTGHPYVLFNPLFDDKALADDVVLHCQRHGSFRQYVSEKSEDHRFSVIPKPAGEACPLGLVAAPDDANACILANRYDGWLHLAAAAQLGLQHAATAYGSADSTWVLITCCGEGRTHGEVGASEARLWLYPVPPPLTAYITALFSFRLA